MHQIGNTIALGLAAGMNQEDVGRIMERLQHRAQEMSGADAEELARGTFMATRTMARLGVSSEATTELVCQALLNRYTAREMEAMRNSFMTRSRNENPTNLAKSYANEVQGGKGAGSLGSSGMGGSGMSGGHGGSGDHGGSGGGHK
jgi:CubicO group peptidase (beta-lactamase class C family)